ncbi:hypothetical protein ACHWQZ_G015855 [Mnemiopsis leidyi]
METNAVISYQDRYQSTSSLPCAAGYYSPCNLPHNSPAPYFSAPSLHPPTLQPGYLELESSGFYRSPENAASPQALPITSPSSGNFSSSPVQMGAFSSSSPVQMGAFSSSSPEQFNEDLPPAVIPLCSSAAYQLTVPPNPSQFIQQGTQPQLVYQGDQFFPSSPEIGTYEESIPGSCYHGYSTPRYTPAEQLSPPTEVSQLQRNLYQTNSELHKNCMIAQFLASSGQFAKFFEFVTTSEFREQDNTGVQQLWLHCLYTQHAASKKTPLTAVDRHRLRKRYPYPASIWNGETTSYNLKQSARRLLAIAFSVDQYPSNEEKKHLADVCEMDYLQICNWFKNRRMREKRLQKEQKISNHKSSSSPTSKPVSEAVSELALLQKDTL